jgi:uncharacterized protein (TIGR02145 family)
MFFLILLFFSSSCSDENDSNTFIDSRDGQVYKWVRIGDQIWMAENLNFKPDSEPWVYNNNDLAYTNVYGRLYDWETACKVCPEGWHLPEKTEVEQLRAFLGGDSIAGGKMKEAGTKHWASPNLGATNESSFTALPGGIGYIDELYYVDSTAWFWTATWIMGEMAWGNRLHYNFTQFYNNVSLFSHGLSVRCVKNE